MTKSQPLAQRFWKKVQKAGEDECWLWIGAKGPRQYGRIYSDGGSNLLYAHRVSCTSHR